MAMEKAVNIQVPATSPDQSDQNSAAQSSSKVIPMGHDSVPCKVFVYDVEISPADFIRAKDAWKACELCGDIEMEPGEIITTMLNEAGRYRVRNITTMGHFKNDGLVGESIVLKDLLASYKYNEGQNPLEEELLLEAGNDLLLGDGTSSVVKYDEENDLIVAQVTKNRQEMQMFVIRKKIAQEISAPAESVGQLSSDSNPFNFPPLSLDNLKKDNLN